tara:strand:+ start:158 stop:883 length:726 start_codon:yes stop_codon:yes gene_type:complete
MEEDKDIINDSKTLKILKVKDPKEMILKPYPDILPNPYSSCLLIIGSVKSGKSTIISNLFLNPSFYGVTYFQELLVISNTILNDYTMRFMRDTFEYKSEYNDGMIKSIIEKQKKFGDRSKMPHMALIADDILSTGFKKNNELSFLASRFRHYNIFYVITTQNFRSLSPIIRSNATSVIITKQNNENELSKIVEEYGPMFGGDKEFIRLYNEAINFEPYSFMYLRLDENPAHCWQSFNKRIK